MITMRRCKYEPASEPLHTLSLLNALLCAGVRRGPGDDPRVRQGCSRRGYPPSLRVSFCTGRRRILDPPGTHLPSRKTRDGQKGYSPSLRVSFCTGRRRISDPPGTHLPFLVLITQLSCVGFRITKLSPSIAAGYHGAEDPAHARPRGGRGGRQVRGAEQLPPHVPPQTQNPSSVCVTLGS